MSELLTKFVYMTLIISASRRGRYTLNAVVSAGPRAEKFKVGLLPSKKFCCICFNKSTLKIMKNGFCFILNALFILKIFKLLSGLFGRVEKTAW